MLPVFAEGRIEIGLINKILLTRIESNVDDLRLCRNVVVYSHGFPDSSVVPVPNEASRECEHFSSRMPRKLCKHFLQTLNSVAFVAFNGRGIPGSSQAPVGSVEEAPVEFFDKTLTQDLDDLASVVRYMKEERCPSAQLLVCGLSTGAFLSLAYAARPDLQPPGGICGCVALACVRDIPASLGLDFSPEQQAAARDTGWCYKEFFPHGGAGNPQRWRLGGGYLASYAAFPPAPALGRALRAPVLLVHGTDDRHVPFGEHAEALRDALAGAGADARLCAVPRGNHFLSASAALAKALAAIAGFAKAALARPSAPPPAPPPPG